MKRNRLGIIGVGQIVHDGYLPILPYIDRIEKVYLYDINTNNIKYAINEFEKWIAESVFEKEYSLYFNNPQVKAIEFLKKIEISSNLNEIINSSDIILITTPPNTHIEIALKCVKNNKRVIVEKPLTSDKDIFEKMDKKELQLLEQNLFYLESFIFNPAYIELKKLIDDNIIGVPFFIEICIANTGPSGYLDNEIWRKKKNISGGGVMYDWGVHTLSLALFLLGYNGEQIEVNTHKVIKNEDNIDIYCLSSLEFKFSDNHTKSIVTENSWLNNGDLNSLNGASWIKIEGVLGSIIMEFKKVNNKKEYVIFIKLRRQEIVQKTLSVKFPHDSYHNALQNLMSDDLNIFHPFYTFDYGLNILKLIDKILGKS